MSTKRTSLETPEQLVDHLRSLIAEAEKALSSSFTENAEERLSSLRERLGDLKEKVQDGVTFAREKIVTGAKQADSTIRDHPYESLAIALGIGLLLGIFLRRSED
jgi:ElaB/YqjD/DUF883 family membrane-anchored ribosome-binding protein